MEKETWYGTTSCQKIEKVHFWRCYESYRPWVVLALPVGVKNYFWILGMNWPTDQMGPHLCGGPLLFLEPVMWPFVGLLAPIRLLYCSMPFRPILTIGMSRVFWYVLLCVPVVCGHDDIIICTVCVVLYELTTSQAIHSLTLSLIYCNSTNHSFVCLRSFGFMSLYRMPLIVKPFVVVVIDYGGLNGPKR